MKRRSDEAQHATLAWGAEKPRFGSSCSTTTGSGRTKPYLCGDEITIADYFGAGIVTLGELIDCDFSPYPNVQRWLSNMKKSPNWAPVNAEFYGLRDAMQAQNFVRL